MNIDNFKSTLNKETTNLNHFLRQKTCTNDYYQNVLNLYKSQLVFLHRQKLQECKSFEKKIGNLYFN